MAMVNPYRFSYNPLGHARPVKVLLNLYLNFLEPSGLLYIYLKFLEPSGPC